jgi:hypothetical protein
VISEELLEPANNVMMEALDKMINTKIGKFWMLRNSAHCSDRPGTCMMETSIHSTRSRQRRRPL